MKPQIEFNSMTKLIHIFLLDIIEYWRAFLYFMKINIHFKIDFYRKGFNNSYKEAFCAYNIDLFISKMNEK